MKERLKFLRKEKLKKTQQEFANELGMSKSTLEGYEYGRRAIPERTLKLICREYKVNYDWLVDGIGEIFTDDGDVQAIIDSMISEDNEEDREFLTLLAKYPQYWGAIKRIMEELIKTEEK